MREPSTRAGAGILFPELLSAPEPAPPVRSRGPWVLRLLARVALWSLIVAGALRGLVPAPERPAPATAVTVAAQPPDARRGEAVAAAFLREYLTVGDDRKGRAQRLGQFAAAGVDLLGSVSVPNGVVQYADHVVAAGSRPVPGGLEVTVLTHVLQVQGGVYRDGGTLAFVVPLAVRREGVAVRDRPRPTTLPVASGLSLPRRRAAPAALSQPATRMARQAVLAYVTGDTATLVRLGGGRAPATRPLPTGWRATGVGRAEVSGATATPTAAVPVRVRPPSGRASYLVTVRVQLAAGPRGLTVRQVESGGSA